ncbi:MAG: hypothetical protein HYZ53_16850 [Planctomycetes bacterium]|nr:hypothetical protein [Planctomycetota bacterium]
MSTSAPVLVVPVHASPVEAPRLPWHAPAVVLGATSIVVGLLWDISWHISIGRDTFWTPAHLAIYLGGGLPGLACAWLAIKTTFFGSADERAASVGVWGFRAPLGAWVTLWGAAAMLTSAPFDDWWHNAYGLDVEILSPPHVLLAAGMFSVVAGALVLVLALQNRAGGVAADSGAAALRARRTSPSAALFAYASGIFLTLAATLMSEFAFPNEQHRLLFYKVACGAFPLILVAAAMASRLRWAATAVAAGYTGILLAMVWSLQLFPAQPRLAPIYNPITHMVPPPFPLLLVIPALLLDLCLRWVRRGDGLFRDAAAAILLGVVFLAAFLPVQWFFAQFLLSPAADNWFFAGNRWWSYMDSPGEYRHRFFGQERDAVTAAGLAVALAFAVVSSGIGLRSGRWLAKVLR